MKKVWSIGRIFYVLLVFLAVSAAAVYFAPEYALLVSLIALGIGLILVIASLLSLHNNIGKIIAGVSAGAILMFDYGYGDKDAYTFNLETVRICPLDLLIFILPVNNQDKCTQ